MSGVVVAHDFYSIPKYNKMVFQIMMPSNRKGRSVDQNHKLNIKNNQCK